MNFGPDDGQTEAAGTPQEAAAHPASHTARYLKQVLEQHPPQAVAA